MNAVNGVIKKMYELIEKEFDSAECGRYTAYGITYKTEQNSVSVNDLTLDKDAAQKFVLLCNQLKLDPAQLFDAAEDFVFEDGLVKV